MPATQPPPALGQIVGEAQTALSALLQVHLDRVSISFEGWLVLNLLATRGPALTAGAVGEQLAAAPQAEPAVISKAVEQLESTGLVHVTDGIGDTLVELTEDGQALHGRLRPSIAGTTAKLLAGLGADDVETTLGVLREVTTRAKALR